MSGLGIRDAQSIPVPGGGTGTVTTSQFNGLVTTVNAAFNKLNNLPNAACNVII